MKTTNQLFIEKNLEKPLSEIALLLSNHPDLDKNFILNQINGIQKSKTKLPTYYSNQEIKYPVGLSIEQCSSEQTAKFKSNLLSGKSIIDLTGGFGVDTYFFSKQFKSVTYLEKNDELFEITTHNFKVLKAPVQCYQTACEDFLSKTNQQFDVAYIDPSRRNETSRVFQLADCTPNVVELLPQLFKIGKKILVKTSPLLDIKKTISDLQHVSKVWIVSVNNDCKEVLYLLEKSSNPPKITTVNLSKIIQSFTFNYEIEASSIVEYSEPLDYLYEPNASVLKSGAFKSIADKFQLKKLNINTHIYTSNHLNHEFPGRIFKTIQILDYNEKKIKKLGIKKANIAVRNFPDSVEQIKKKLNLSDGGNNYIFAVKDHKERPTIILTEKV